MQSCISEYQLKFVKRVITEHFYIKNEIIFFWILPPFEI